MLCIGKFIVTIKNAIEPNFFQLVQTHSLISRLTKAVSDLCHIHHKSRSDGNLARYDYNGTQNPKPLSSYTNTQPFRQTFAQDTVCFYHFKPAFGVNQHPVIA